MPKKLILLTSLLLWFALPKAQDLRQDTIDIRSYILNLDLSDFTTKVLRGEAVIDIQAKQNGVNSIRLDLLKLTVDSVKVNSVNTTYSYNDSVIAINLPVTLNATDATTLRIYYHGNPYRANGDFGGFYWNTTYAFNIGVSFLADPHTYGRVWFPCFDNFEQRSLYEFYVTTKSIHKAFCNGLLLDVATSGNKKTWHWKLTQNIPSYLASVAVSDYATVEDTVNGMTGTLQILLAARATDTTNLKNLFVHLHDAFHIQEEAWGPYRWDRVGYCIVPFNAGAMEHATNIGFMTYYLNTLSAEAEHTMAHELSHHWFGNLVTCKTASEMWLNEGWARYNEHLFFERLYGDSVYTSAVRINHEDVLHKAHISDGAYLPVSGVPTESTYGSTVYNKGADVIHTLRYYMGDTQFFSCVKNYLNAFAWQNATTEQLRDYLTQCSGINLSDCFNDFITAPGFTHFSLEQIQTLPTTNAGFQTNFVIRQRLHQAPHLYQNVPLKVSFFDAGWNRTDIVVNAGGECTSYSANTTNEPVYIAVDFDENIQDAITDEWNIIKQTGSYDFGTAKLQLQVNSITDSALLRVEHNWIRPEPFKTKIEGLHLHDKRYWTVDGIIPADFSATATLDYDGTDASLDATFITASEDSLVVLYRPNAETNWAFADSFFINKQGSASNKVGKAVIYKLAKGQYTLAIWNSRVTDTTSFITDCVYSGLTEIETQKNFNLYPNPASELITVTFDPNTFTKLELRDMLGRKLLEQKLSPEETSVDLPVKHYRRGTYLITLSGNNINTTKKLIKQ